MEPFVHEGVQIGQKRSRHEYAWLFVQFFCALLYNGNSLIYTPTPHAHTHTKFVP